VADFLAESEDPLGAGGIRITLELSLLRSEKPVRLHQLQAMFDSLTRMR